MNIKNTSQHWKFRSNCTMYVLAARIQTCRSSFNINFLLLLCVFVSIIIDINAGWCFRVLLVPTYFWELCRSWRELVSTGVKEDWLATCTWIRGLKYDWTEGRQEVCRLEEELDKDAVCHQFCSTCTANKLPRKLWMGLGTSTSEGKLFKLWNMQMTLY